MFTVNFSILLDGDMFSNSYSYHCFRSALLVVEDIIDDYAIIPAKHSDCWTITMTYNDCTVLTLNSAMF